MQVNFWYKSVSCWLIQQHKDKCGKSHVCCLVMYVEDKYTDRWVEKVCTSHKTWAEKSMEGWRRQPESWILPCTRGKVEQEGSSGLLELETRVKLWWWFIGLLTETGLIFLKSINITHGDLRVPFISTTLSSPSFLPHWCSFTADFWRYEWVFFFFSFLCF